MTHDPINNPSHYAEGRKFEPIEVIEDWKLNYRMGNVLKYVSRAGRKQDAIEDLKKAVWYLQREIEVLEGARPESQYTPNYDEVYEFFMSNVPYDATDSVDLWDPVLGPIDPQPSDYQGPLYAPHPDLNLPVRAAAADFVGQAEWDHGKDEDAFENDDDIIRIFERRGLVIGVKKGGGSVILGESKDA